MSNETQNPRQYVLDTNVLISDPSCLYRFDEHDIVIPMTVIEELDKLKDDKGISFSMRSRDARAASQTIKAIMNGHGKDISKGVPFGESGGFLRVFNDYQLKKEMSLPAEINDNRIISTALSLQKNEQGKTTILVSKDINMQLKAYASGLKRVEDYENDQQIDDIEYLPSGVLVLPDGFLDNISKIETTRENKKTIYCFAKEDLDAHDEVFDAIYLNQYWYSEDDDLVFRVDRIDENGVDAIALNKKQMMSRKAFGIEPRNLMQAFAFDGLLDPDVDFVQLTGPAGSGKTLLALAAGLEQSSFEPNKGRVYERILVTRNTPDMAEDIGFLPGTEEEKMTPWLAAFTDTLEVLAGCDDPIGNTEDKLSADEMTAVSLSMIKRKSNLQFKSMNFMRGRSFQKTFAILDESQNLTPHQMKSLITRMGSGSKLVVLGNLSQIDAKYVTALTSGLTHAVTKMKNYSNGSVVCLPGGERSELASFAEENL